MSYLLAGVVLVFLYGFFRHLYIFSVSSAPSLYYKVDSTFVRSVIAACPILLETYVPPLLWGKSGHIQTIVYGKLGRVKPPFPKGKRQHELMGDGATLTFDIFTPCRSHRTGGDYTILVCPGIANSSESSYICTFVDYALEHGFRVVVQNHLGALKSVKLTSPRMYTWGGTGEFHLMTQKMMESFPDTKLIAVGFSMGANIVVKYFGEDPKHERNFLAAMSICQGYDLNRAKPLLMSWTNCCRGYVYAMTMNQLSILRHHHDNLFNLESKRRFGNLDLKEIYNATSLVGLDDAYVKKRHGFEDLETFYSWSSSANYINNITLPLLILNSEDDPIVPDSLLDVPKNYVASHDNAIFVLTKHGGHLGYFEHGVVIPDQVTWLDRVIVQYANAAVTLCDGKVNMASQST